jgi:hypothetical protein
MTWLIFIIPSLMVGGIAGYSNPELKYVFIQAILWGIGWGCYFAYWSETRRNQGNRPVISGRVHYYVQCYVLTSLTYLFAGCGMFFAKAFAPA